MVERELARGAPESAQSLLRELDAPPEDLADRVAEAMDARRRETARLRGLLRDLDPATERRARLYLAGLIGVVWTLSPLAIELGRRAGREVTHAAAITWDSVGLVLVTLGCVLFRERLRASALNRRLALAAWIVFLAQLVLHIGDTLGGFDALTTTIHQFPVWAAVAAGVAIGVDALFLLPAMLYLAAFIVLRVHPEATFPLMTACNAVALSVLVRMSRRRETAESAD